MLLKKLYGFINENIEINTSTSTKSNNDNNETNNDINIKVVNDIEINNINNNNNQDNKISNYDSYTDLEKDIVLHANNIKIYGYENLKTIILNYIDNNKQYEIEQLIKIYNINVDDDLYMKCYMNNNITIFKFLLNLPNQCFTNNLLVTILNEERFIYASVLIKKIQFYKPEIYTILDYFVKTHRCQIISFIMMQSDYFHYESFYEYIKHLCCCNIKKIYDTILYIILTTVKYEKNDGIKFYAIVDILLDQNEPNELLVIKLIDYFSLFDGVFNDGTINILVKHNQLKMIKKLKVDFNKTMYIETIANVKYYHTPLTLSVTRKYYDITLYLLSLNVNIYKPSIAISDMVNVDRYDEQLVEMNVIEIILKVSNLSNKFSPNDVYICINDGFNIESTIINNIMKRDKLGLFTYLKN